MANLQMDPDRDIARASTLAAPRYFTKEIFDEEKDRIFSSTWQLVGMLTKLRLRVITYLRPGGRAAASGSRRRRNLARFLTMSVAIVPAIRPRVVETVSSFDADITDGLIALMELCW